MKKIPKSSKGIAIGAAIGTALGIALNNIALGIGVGIVFAAASITQSKNR